MRFLPIAVALLAGACAPRTARCDASESAVVAFSAPTAHDTVTVRAFGPDCAKAIGVYAIRDAEGNAIWAWAAPLKQAFGDIAAANGEVRPFLRRWARPTLSRTGSAPDWSRLAAGQTTLDRLTYQDIRARDLPMLCHFSGTAKEICIFWEPVAGAAGLLLERNYEETNR